MADETRPETGPEASRIHLWRMGLIADLGEDLRRVIRVMYPDKEALSCMLRVLRRFTAPSIIQQGAIVYWEYLSDYYAMVARQTVEEDKERDPWKTP